MTVKNVDYKQEPIENPFNFQKQTLPYGYIFEIVYADQSILKLNPEERTTKCV